MITPLHSIEARLRTLLPADLYATAWLDSRYNDESSAEKKRQVADVLISVTEHLRTMQHILYDYVPRDVTRRRPEPGELYHDWQEGVLMFTDLSGFTGLMEANAEHGRAGAEAIHKVLNRYFSMMIHIVVDSGGTLLQFTGDAILARFRSYDDPLNVAQAVRAGVRMQRAMVEFLSIQTPQGRVALTMRIGIHAGRYLNAEVGTPLRMEHLLLGEDVKLTKIAEGAGRPGMVCLTEFAANQVRENFALQPTEDGFWLVLDDISESRLRHFDLPSVGQRLPRLAQLDLEPDSLVKDIMFMLDIVEPLASYLPNRIVRELVESVSSASKSQIPFDFAEVTVVFVNLMGLSEAADRLNPGEEINLTEAFSSIFAHMNAAVESRGGVLKKVTYHPSGSDVMIFFGVPGGHSDDPARAASAALAIRDVVLNNPKPIIQGEPAQFGVQIGVATGMVFAAEIGALRSRREYNVLGDTVNTAARLMVRAEPNQIQMTDVVYEQINERFECKALGAVPLKGKKEPVPLYELAREIGGDVPDDEDDLPAMLKNLPD
jgi:class 3 adenylate cyclase